MRELTPALADEISEARATHPIYLIEVTLDQPYALSTRQTLNWNGVTWQSGMVGTSSIQVSPDGGSVSFLVENFDDRFTSAALSGAFQRQPVKVWWGYGLGEHLDLFEPGLFVPGLFQGPPIGKPELLFSGLISAIPEIGTWLRIEATKETPRGYPRMRIRPPIANHLTPAGANIVFGGETYRVETQ